MTTLDNWLPLKVGAGGYVTGIDIAPDNTMVVRTDTYGAYIWNGTQWQQLVTSTSMPSEDVVPDANSHGVYEIRIAPSNTNILYMEFLGTVYRSDNKGESWSATSFRDVTEDPNDQYRMNGQKMAVDPNNPDVVYVGTPQDGLFVTTDGGASWQRVTSVPVSSQDSNGLFPGITGIAFDPTSGVTGGKTNVIYASSYGHGVYESTDGGVSWSALNGGPSDVENASVSTDGVYYAAGNNDTEVWRYTNSTWTQLLVADINGIHTVAPDPFNPDRIIVTTNGGSLNVSLDGGATWSGTNWSAQLSATDIPWLANTDKYMGMGGLVFDQLVPDKIWASAGVGVWNTSVQQNFTWTTPVVWNSQSLGIEQLVASEIIVPPGGHPILASQDRPFFYLDNLDLYPSSYGPTAERLSGWSLDYASSDPKFIVGVADWWGGVERSGYSTDGGQSWTVFPSLPPFAAPVAGQTNSGSIPLGGSIAASSPTNIVWAAANGFEPYYTKDGGATWSPVVLPGVSDWRMFDWAYFLNAHTVTADRVLPDTFYLYFADHGVYRSTDGGATWGQVFSGEISAWSNWNSKLESVPGQAGHLFFTGGPLGSPSPNPDDEGFFQSTDGGASWTAVANVLEVETFGFGAPVTPGAYPSIYIVGWVNNVYGIWQSNDDAQTWSQIGVWPTDSLDHITTIAGDPDVYGQVYIGFAGSGYAYLPAQGDLPNVPTINKAPVITSNEGTATTTISIPENTVAVTTVAATDSDSDKLVYSILGGADASLFTINATTGALAFLKAPDYEHANDFGADNHYDVTVQASDGQLTASQAISVNVTNVSPETPQPPVNNAPVITSNGGTATATISVPENTMAVATVTATDSDSDKLVYSILGGADASLFTINATTGALAFLKAPDYEHANDYGVDNHYDVIVQASDGQLTASQAISVNVTNVSPETLTGDDGSNLFLASADREPFSGLGGNDTVSYALAQTGVIANLANPGANTGDAAGDSYNSIENLIGSAFNDKLTGDANNNVLEGSEGNDTLVGNRGNDTLIGGLGTDTLDGGSGRNLFVYLSPNEGGDTILNAKSGTIGISASGFGGGLVAGQDLVTGVTFVANRSPTAPTTAGTFLYDTNDHNLRWDADGSGPGAAVQIAHFDTAAHLKADDFKIMNDFSSDGDAQGLQDLANLISPGNE